MHNWLIWSIEHNAWWRPARCGYTETRAEAGRYGFFEALDVIENANLFLRTESPNEALVPDLPDATVLQGLGKPTAYQALRKAQIQEKAVGGFLGHVAELAREALPEDDALRARIEVALEAWEIHQQLLREAGL